MSRQDFKIGADPEFGFKKNGRIIEAVDIIECECEDTDQFGLDGCTSIAEIRPKPSANPLKVVSDIAKVLHDGVERNPETATLEWKAGSIVSDDTPIGGHIHFGTHAVNYANKPGREVFLDTLDRYLAQTVILLEDPREAETRRNDEYGGLSDCRDQPWGFEYRTLSSWLTSPYIAQGVLCLAKAIVWETMYNGLGDHDDEITDVIQDDFMAARLDPIRKKFENGLWRDIRKFELYKKYKKPIDLLHTLIEKRRNWFPTCGMKVAWGIESIPDVGPMKRTTLKTIWSGVKA